LLVDGITRKRGQHVSAIINHHAWENAKFTKEVIGLIVGGVEEFAFDEVRPLFRTFTSLLNIKDSLARDRIEWSLSSLLAVMRQQERFWKITDLCIEHLIRIAKKNADVYQWMHEHADRWGWLIEWLTAYPNPPTHMDTNIAMYKPGKGGHHVSMMWSMNRGFGPQGLSGKKKKAVLELIRDGKEIDKSDASDSDEDLSERVFTVNQKVDCKDTASKWLISTVVEVKEGMVFVHYDGWSNKWDEWLESDSPRIAKLNRYTNPPLPPAEVAGGNGGGEGQQEGAGTSMAVVVHGAAGAAQDP